MSPDCKPSEARSNRAEVRPKPTLLTALKLKAIFSLIATTLLMKEMLLIDIRSTNASAAEFILYRLKL